MRYLPFTSSVEPSDTVDHKDLAIAYLMGGTAKVVRLCAWEGVSPEVALEAWNTLHQEGHAGEDLGVALATMFAPLPRGIMPAA